MLTHYRRRDSSHVVWHRTQQQYKLRQKCNFPKYSEVRYGGMASWPRSPGTVCRVHRVWSTWGGCFFWELQWRLWKSSKSSQRPTTCVQPARLEGWVAQFSLPRELFSIVTELTLWQSQGLALLYHPYVWGRSVNRACILCPTILMFGS